MTIKFLVTYENVIIFHVDVEVSRRFRSCEKVSGFWFGSRIAAGGKGQVRFWENSLEKLNKILVSSVLLAVAKSLNL